MGTILRSMRGLHVSFGLFIALFLYVVFNFYSDEKEQVVSKNSARLQSIGELKSDYFNSWYHERNSDGLFLYYNLPANKAFLNLISGNSKPDSILLTRYLQYMSKNHDFENIYVLDKNKNTVLALNDSASTRYDNDSLDAAINSGKLVFSSIYLDESPASFSMDIYVPLIVEEQLNAVVVLKMNLAKSLFPHLSSWQQLNSSGESLMLYPSGDSILYLIPNKNNSGFTTFTRSTKDSNLVAAKVMTGKRGVLQGRDYKGNEVLADIRKIEKGKWYLVSKIDVDEILQPVRKTFFNNLLILCLIVLSGAFSLLYYHAKVNYSHLQKLSESENKLKTILDHSTIVFYSHTADHIITYVSPQSESILGYKPEELAINWKDLVTDNEANIRGSYLTEQAILTGEVQEPYELELKRKDGSYVWAEVHETPVVVNGKTVAMVGSLTPITQRKKAQQALSETEAIFRHFMENSPIYVFFKDEQIRAIRLSNNYEKMLGRPLKDILGKTMDELFPSELAKSMIEDDKSILRERKTVVVNEQLDGRYYTTIKFPIIIDDVPRYLAGYTIDLTEFHLAQQALKESEEKYRQLFTNMLDGVYKSTPEGKFVEVNTAFVKMLGYESKEELLAIDIKKDLYFKEEDRQSVVLEEQSKEMAVFRLKKKDGSEIWVEDHGLYTYDELGNVIYYEGILRDITERVEAEKRIHTLSQALEQSPISALIMNRKGLIEYVNPRFTELTGYTTSEMQGKKPRIFRTGFQSGEKQVSIWDIVNSGKEWRQEIRNEKKNGEIYWVNAIISPIVNKEGVITNFIALEEDITEKKKIIEELIVSKEKAEEMNRLKSYFFANMSHELRTPFVGIIGYAELLMQNVKEKESREMIESILDSSNRLMDTLNKILTLTKLEFEPPKFTLGRFDLNTLLDECEKTFYPAAQTKKLSFRVERLPSEVILETDGKLLRDMIFNLISNAIKYTDKGTVEICAEAGPKSVLINVKDTGIGIPKEKQDQIWLPFRQVSEGLNRSFQGTGLGLTITRKYAELLGAGITLESEYKKGSKFTVELPYKVGN